MLARTKRTKFIKEYRAKKAKILQYKIDNMDKKKLEKEVKEQKANDEKEMLTNEINKVGGLFENIDALDKAISKKTKKECVIILQRQLQFRKTVLGQKFPEIKWLQMGEKGNNNLIWKLCGNI